MNVMNDRIVYFNGSLPYKGKAPVGGGEVGNMRTLRMLQSFGYKTKVIRRIRSNAADSKVKRMISVFDVWEDFLKGEFNGHGFTFWIIISILVDIAAFIFFDLAFRKSEY